jgi:protein-S-isoprenylcysteine O-methyltransferase Ste14
MGIGLIVMLVPASAWLNILKATPVALIAEPLWSAPEAMNWIWFLLVLAGFAFCWWARLHLGRLWSGFTTLKEGHYLVDSGPYGIVRHPIYSGAIFAAMMTAALNATLLSVLGFLALAVGFAMVARLEERFLRQQLGEQIYDAYAARVPMLAPTWSRGSRSRA